MHFFFFLKLCYVSKAVRRDDVSKHSRGAREEELILSRLVGCGLSLLLLFALDRTEERIYTQPITGLRGRSYFLLLLFLKIEKSSPSALDCNYKMSGF